jgi:uncharacterized protein (TIGR02646 family)
MRKLQRVELSEHALRTLWNNTVGIVEAGYPKYSAKARRDEAKRRWDQKPDVAFAEVRSTLREMAPGIERCMYCESNEGTHIEHFWPRRLSPCRTFDWHNLLLACETCNSNYKRDKFPRKNGKPLLINPVEDDPRKHLQLNRTGKFVPLTDEGKASISVFGLDRGPLERTREDAWVTVDGLIGSFANACRRGNSALSLAIQKALCRYPFSSVFVAIIDAANKPGASESLSVECLSALETHPEIKTWLL